MFSVQSDFAHDYDGCFPARLLIRVILDLRPQPLLVAESGDLIGIGASLIVPLGQYGDSVYGVPLSEASFAFVGL